jgi:predicted transcriptional regulator
MGKRYNIQLDEERSARLDALAERTHVQAGTLARSLLSMAIDEANPDSTIITEILNAIPGAFERHQQGRDDARRGRTVPLEEL